MNEEAPVKKMLVSRVDIKRQKGRLRLRWADQVELALTPLNVTSRWRREKSRVCWRETLMAFKAKLP